MRPHDQELLRDVAELSPEELRSMTAHPVTGWRKLFGVAERRVNTQLPEGVEGVFEPVTPSSDAPDYGVSLRVAPELWSVDHPII